MIILYGSVYFVRVTIQRHFFLVQFIYQLIVPKNIAVLWLLFTVFFLAKNFKIYFKKSIELQNYKHTHTF